MHDAFLFVPDAIEDALRSDLASGLRAIADALTSKQLDGIFLGSIATAGGRHDERIHLRITIDLAAPILRSIRSSPSPPKLDESR